VAHLSDDDVPTMTGTGSLVEELEDSGDTTSADLGVPVAAAIHAAAEAAAAEKAAREAEAAETDDAADGHDAEDRTMSNAPSTVATGAGPPTHQSAVAPIPRGVVVPSPSPTTVDDDELEDSVTTTAPRVPHSNLAIPGSVLIRTVEDDDDMQDETEVKTLANLPPDLQKVLKNARMQDANAPQRSQPPPPPRPAAGVPARPATGPMPVSAAVATLPSRVDEPAAATIPQTEPLPPAAIPTELDSDELADDEDDEDEVLPADEEAPTAQSLAPRVGSMPDSVVGPPSPIAAVPKDVPPTSRASAIDPDTSKSTVSEAVAAAMIAAGESDEPETRPGLGGDASATDDPPTRPGLVDPPTRPGLGEPPTHPRSVDGKSSPRIDVRPAAETDHDDSITTQAPKHASDLIAAAIAKVTGPRASDDDDDDDSTEGTTTKVKRSKLPAAPPPAAGAPPPTSKEPPLPADEESESITTQAPGPLTNMLRVIAADRTSVPEGQAIEEQEPEENRTAVMANAPLIRAAEAHQQQNGRSPLSVPTQLGLGPRAVAAQQLNPTSESGLRVARPGSGSGERISTAAMNAAPTSPIDPRISGIGPSASARGADGGLHGLAHANTELAFPQMSGPPPAQQPSMHDVPVGKSPSYGPLVAIVAIVSFVVPITLFLALRGNDAEPKPGTPNEASSDFQKLDAPSRTKADKNKKSPDAAGSASATPSASASSKGPNRFPFNRR